MEKIHVPKGTRDILDEEIVLWYRVENIVRTMASLFDYHEIRTPLFEHTELFSRGVGEATDIVQKEMYTFTDKGGRSITLRPEGTAPVMRSFIEQGLYVSNPRIKWFYMGPMFRYERPQAGRMRQFHQFGFEALGYTSPACDAEIIFLAWTIYQEIGLKNLTLEINNLGCHQCKPQYIEVLKQFLDSHREELCENCRSRMDKNPLRILDCKEAGCQGVLHSSNFPVIQSYLCDDCRHHQDELMDNLARTGVSVIINPYLVRGLDYYIKTAFEIKTGELGSQDAIGGGGRYDHLSDTLGVKGIPGVGFAAGMERIILL
ncbi:MAG: histidine--tRNA ligase, partial [Candidatus Atribacteria bacterium]|nr:histidine--tRNA ligase [Candidatus Atribacteria bacterium]